MLTATIETFNYHILKRYAADENRACPGQPEILRKESYDNSYVQ
nr:MAG TPA: hypothetical protein [Caudoviricetes sp.]